MLDVLPIMDFLPTWLKGALAVVTSVLLLIKSLKFVQEGEQGIRLRFGRAVRDKDGVPVVIEPGWIFLIPFMENLAKRHVREQYIDFTDQEIILDDNSTFLVSSSLKFKVVDVYKAQFHIDVLRAGMTSEGMIVLKEMFGGIELISEAKEYGKVSSEMLKNIKPRVENWGVEAMSFGITNFTPTERTSDYISAKASVEAKVKALQDADIDHKKYPQLAAALIGIPVVSNISQTGPEDERWNRNEGEMAVRPKPKVNGFQKILE